jgi:hypothetical protein
MAQLSLTPIGHSNPIAAGMRIYLPLADNSGPATDAIDPAAVVASLVNATTAKVDESTYNVDWMCGGKVWVVGKGLYQVGVATDAAIETRRAQIRAVLKARPDNGVTFTVGGQTLTLPASQGFQDRLTRLLAAYREAGAAGSTSVTIATRNGSRTMTLTQLRAVYKAYMDAVAAINAPLNQVDAAATMADLDAITLQ